MIDTQNKQITVAYGKQLKYVQSKRKLRNKKNQKKLGIR